MAKTIIELMDDMHLSNQDEFLDFYDAMSTNNTERAQSILANNPSLLNQIMNSENINKIIQVINKREAKPNEDINVFLDNLLTQFQEMIDNTEILGAYNNSVQYYTHNFVYYNSKGYYCYKEPPIGTLPTDTNYWLEYDIRGLKGYGGISNLNYVGNWTSTQNYATGDMVIFQNKLWYAIAPNVNFAPNLNHYPWNLIMVVMPANKTVIQKEEPVGFYYNEGDLWFKIIEGEDFSQNAWTEGLSDTQSRFASGTFMIGDIIYVVGGHDVTIAVTDVHEAYDTLTNTWSVKASYPIKIGGNAGFTLNGLGYIVGGLNTSLVYVDNVYSYNPATNTWTAKNKFPVATSPVTEVGVRNGIAYVGVGVTNTGINSSAIYEYNSANDSWSVLTNIPTLRVEAFTGIIGDKIVFAGGEKEIGVVDDTVEIYDFITKTWTTGTKMPTPRFLGGRMVHHDSLYTVGGLDKMLYSTSKNEVYDIVNNTWKEDIPLLYAGNSLSSEYTSKYGYIIGGIDIQYAMIDGRVQIYTFAQEESSFEMQISTSLINPNSVSNSLITENNDELITEDGDNIVNQNPTTIQARTVSIPMVEDGIYDYYINWGDGNESGHITTYNDINATHTYAKDGEYTIKLIGNLSKLRFSDGIAMSLQKVLKCKLKLQDIDNMFLNCINLTEVPGNMFERSLSLTSANSTFANCTSLKNIPAGIFGNNTNIISLYSTFANSGLVLLPGALFNSLINALSFDSVFYNCASLTNVPMGLFNSNNQVTTYAHAFSKCVNIETLPEGLLSSSPLVETYEGMFSGCTKLSNLPTNLFGNACATATNFSYMFDDTNISELPENLFSYASNSINYNNVFNNTNISSIPNYCFNGRNASWEMSFAIPNIVSLGNNALNGLNITSDMFKDSQLVEIGDNAFWNIGAVIIPNNPTNLLENSSKLTTLGNIDLLQVPSNIDLNSMLNGCIALVNISGFKTTEDKPSIHSNISFSSCPLNYSSLENIIDSLMVLDINNKKTLTLGTSNLNKLTEVDKLLIINKNWILTGYTPAVTQTVAENLVLRYAAIEGSSAKTYISSSLYFYVELLDSSSQVLTQYAVDKVTGIIYDIKDIPQEEYYVKIDNTEMWIPKGNSGDSNGALLKAKINNYKNIANMMTIGMAQYVVKGSGISNITNMSNLFSGFNNLTSIYINDSLNAQPTTMANMFSGCNSLQNVDFGNMDTSKVTDFSSTFAKTGDVTNLNFTTLIDFSKATNIKDIFKNNYIRTNIGKEKTLGKAYPNTQNYTNGDFTLPNIGVGLMSSIAKMFYPITKGVSKIIDNSDYRLVIGTEAERQSINEYIYPYWNCSSFVEVATYDQALSLIKDRLFSGESMDSSQLLEETNDYYYIEVGFKSGTAWTYYDYYVYKDNGYIVTE